MRILELGSYLAPAYAGMLLAEQGHAVTKWTLGADPLLGLEQGEALWSWVNQGKRLESRHASEIAGLPADDWPDIVLDNFRASAWARWEVDPEALALRHHARWVSLRAEDGGRSFDLIAQARAWLDFAPWTPFYLGDTAAGLWLAFKALADSTPGHYVIGHASALAKLVEGELILDPARKRDATPWDQEEYAFHDGAAHVRYRGETLIEPARDRAWRLANLWHTGGRLRI